MLQFCLIWVECIPKVFHKSFMFSSIQAHFDPRNHLWKFTSSAILISPSLLWRHEWNLCPPEVKNIFGTYARVLSSFLQEYFPVLTLVKQCVVGSCNNSNKTGHSTHFFPKEERNRRQWIKFVQVKRADFLQPTEHSIICGAHFAHEWFEDDGMVKMGLKDKRGYLKSDSVPTIQPQRPEALSEARKLADYGERRKRKTGDSESDSWQKVTNK